jgi:HEAT repeat protein
LLPAAPALAAPAPLQLIDAPDGSLELRRDGTALAKLTLQTPAARRGQPLVREISVEGHPIAEVRLPVRGRPAEETWIGDLTTRPARAIWSGLTGPRDADGETAVYVEVTPERILEYQTAEQVTRCDGQPPRLFPRAWDFASARFRPVLSPSPPAAATKLTALRDDPAMPAGRPLGGFHFVAASTTSSAGSDARGLGAPTALDDGDPKTVWSEGLGGDGRGEFLTARAQSGPYRVRGLRIVPGDASSPAAFKARNRIRSLAIAFGPEPARRFDVEFPQDPAAAGPAKIAAPYWIALPSPVETACVTVVIRDVYRGSDEGPRAGGGTTAISDLAVFTDLDGGEGLARLLADTASGADCASRVPALVSLGPAAVAPLAKAIGTARGEGRACLVQALAGIGGAIHDEAALAALAGALSGASPAEERLIADVLARAEHPPVALLAATLGAAKAPDADRARAARVLGALPGPDATAALLAAVGTGSPALRLEVVQALGRSPGATVALVVNALEAARAATPPALLRRADLIRVLPALARRSPAEAASAHAALRGVLANSDAKEFEVRARAVLALGALPNAGGASGVTDDLSGVAAGDPDPVLRFLAVRELGNPEAAGAVPALRRALEDRDPRVRETAAEGLGAHRDAGAEPLLIAGAKQEDWPIVRRAEIEALGRLCGAAGRDLLVRAIERDVDDVRRAALVGLTRCRDKRAPGALLQLVRARRVNPSLRELAASLIGEWGDPHVTDALADQLPALVNEGEGDLAAEGIAIAAIRSLGHAGGPRSAAALAALTRDEKHPYRQSAVESLGLLCDPTTGFQALAAARQSPDKSLSQSAADAESHCRTKPAPPAPSPPPLP